MSFASLGSSFIDRRPKSTLRTSSNGIAKLPVKTYVKFVDPFAAKKSPIARTWCVSCAALCVTMAGIETTISDTTVPDVTSVVETIIEM